MANSQKPTIALPWAKPQAASAPLAKSGQKPMIPAKDRRPVDDEDSLSLAVIFDIFATTLRQLAEQGPSTTILSDLVQCANDVRVLGVGDGDGLSHLLALANSGPAQERTRLCQKMMGQGVDIGTLAGAEVTPADVHRALLDLVAAAPWVIQDATLSLDARGQTRYFQG